MKKRKRKKGSIITGRYAREINKWIMDYLKNNPTRKYSKTNKPKTEIETLEAVLELVGPEKMLRLYEAMEKNGIESFTFAELYEYSEEKKKKNDPKKK